MPTTDSYSLSLTSRARREIRRLDHQILRRVSKAIDALVQNPRPPGCLKVKDRENLWRIRVGDWRIGYEIDDRSRIVAVVTIGHRREFYD